MGIVVVTPQSRPWSWILAVDPGGTTGWSLLTEPGGKPHSAQDKPYDFERKAHLLLNQDDASDALIVVERFTITAATAKKSQQPDALKQIGALEYLARCYAGLDLNYQSPAEVMRLVTDTRLRALGWYIPGKEHSNDSLRHMVAFLAKRGEIRIPT